MMMTIQRMPQPVIARVHDIATAAGCQLVAMCDLAVASNEARFAVSGVNLGLFCATPSVPLSRNVSRKAAFEMLVTGDFIDARTACERGLVNRVASPNGLDEAVRACSEHRTQAARSRRGGQAAFLPATGNRHRSRVRARCRDDGLQHDGRVRARRHASVHREAPAAMVTSHACPHAGWGKRLWRPGSYCKAHRSCLTSCAAVTECRAYMSFHRMFSGTHSGASYRAQPTTKQRRARHARCLASGAPRRPR